MLSAVVFSACATIISDESYQLAATGQTMVKYENFACSKETLKRATIYALQDRGWTISDGGNPIKARLNKLRQDARLSIQVKEGALWIETKGSLVDGTKAYVPVRYLNNLLVSIRKNVTMMSGR